MAAQAEEPAMMLCSVDVGAQRFGIDTRKIREVLGVRKVQRVPLAPGYIAGMVAYRGEVLTTVSLRAVLGLSRLPPETEACVLVLDGGRSASGAVEQFGLKVERVGGVVGVAGDLLWSNPPALSPTYRAVCCGAFRVADGLIVQLDPERLQPECLAQQRQA